MPRVNLNKVYYEFEDEPFAKVSFPKRRKETVKKVKVKSCGNCGTRLNNKGVCPNCRPKIQDEY